MGEKYRGLPGIVSNQPDVYETKDLPEADQPKEPEDRFESEHIVKSQINIGAAFQTFKGKVLDVDGDVDFSDSIVSRRRKGYGAGPTIFEIGSAHSLEPETPEQKYNRLQHEIQELAESLQQIKAQSTKDEKKHDAHDAATLLNVSALQAQLKELQAEHILGSSASRQGGDASNLLSKLDVLRQSGEHKKKDAKAHDNKQPLAYEVYSLASAGNVGHIAKASELESRLSKIESLIGNDSEKLVALTTDCAGKSILDAVSTLSNKVKLLDPNSLDLIDARLGVLVQKLQLANEKKQAIGGESVAKINEVCELMRKWDVVCSSVPQIVARMRALGELHEQALQFSQALTQLDSVQQQLAKQLETDSTLLSEVRTALAHNVDAVKTNCDSIDKRLKALGK